MPRAYEDEGAYEGKKWLKGGLQKNKIRKKGHMKVKMKVKDPEKCLAQQLSKKCLGPTRALIRPCTRELIPFLDRRFLESYKVDRDRLRHIWDYYNNSVTKALEIVFVRTKGKGETIN